MGTEEETRAASAESFHPSDEDIKKWMACAFDMVGKCLGTYIHISHSLSLYCTVIVSFQSTNLQSPGFYSHMHKAKSKRLVITWSEVTAASCDRVSHATCGLDVRFSVLTSGVLSCRARTH